MGLRIVFVVLGLLTVGLIGLTLRASSANKQYLRYTGKWKGGFTVSGVSTGPDTENDRHRSRLEGYLQVYLDGRKFKLHLEGEQQGIDVDGTWTAERDTLTLNPKNVAIDDQGGEEKRDPNKMYIANDAVNETYRRPLVLKQKGKRYDGLIVTLGPLLGSHWFEKDGP